MRRVSIVATSGERGWTSKSQYSAVMGTVQFMMHSATACF